MKKTIITFLTLCLVAFGLFAGTAPATAGEPKTIAICHATGSEQNPYTNQVVSKTAIVRNGGHGAHAGDIIPSFEYTEKGQTKTYPGKNLNLGTSPANGCLVPVAPLPPTYQPGTCLLPDGIAREAAQPVGVMVESPMALKSGVWSVTYAPVPGYTFGTNPKSFSTPVVPPGPNDPNWDAEAGECSIANTGADAVGTLAIIGGVIAVVGLLLFFVSRKRRDSEA